MKDLWKRTEELLNQPITLGQFRAACEKTDHVVRERYGMGERLYVGDVVTLIAINAANLRTIMEKRGAAHG